MNARLASKPGSSIKPGTIWKLGDHRLALGDCRDKELVKKLVGDAKVALLCCDPPYAVAAVEAKRGFREFSMNKTIKNDHLQTHAEYRVFTREWLEAISPHLARQNAAYIWNMDRMIWSLREGMEDAGWKASQMLVWVKSQAIIGRLDYAPQHELILYGWRGVHAFRRSHDKSVLFHPKPSRSKHHPTTKPIGLIRRLILNSTEMNDVVYDGFLGSGTTLLACEETRRRCVAMELDPEYCLTAIRQWEHLTGNKAMTL